MKVKEFIDCIRPLTTINPETELCIVDSDELEFDFNYIHFDSTHIDLYIKPKSEK